MSQPDIRRRFHISADRFVDKEISPGPFRVIPTVRITIRNVADEFPPREILLDPPGKFPMPNVGAFVTVILIGITGVYNHVVMRGSKQSPHILLKDLLLY